VILEQLSIPIVLAPLAGGPSTPPLAAAVSEAGGFGFLAAGYLTAQTLAERISQTRALTSAPIGVNVFVPGSPAGSGVVEAYAATLAADARDAGVALGAPRFDDDDWAAKIDLLVAAAPSVVSFTFGCPDRSVIAALQQGGSEVWVTVTTPAEALYAVGLGADALVLQGVEAGGHRGSFRDEPGAGAPGAPGAPADGLGLLALLQLVRADVRSVPLVAAGGITTGAGVAAVLAGGAAAAQLGTAFLRCPEAGTAEVHRSALAGAEPTALTRAFTGRLARGIRNRFLDQHTAQAPAAYPEIHYVTAPLRAAARAAGDPGLVNLWAGQSYQLGVEMPAGQLALTLAGEAGAALRLAAGRLPGPELP
jgi:nitronate monooxygenase